MKTILKLLGYISPQGFGTPAHWVIRPNYSGEYFTMKFGNPLTVNFLSFHPLTYRTIITDMPTT